MSEEQEEMKIILLGDCSVGKTSIINRFIGREFETYELSTIGIEHVRQKLEIEYENETKNLILKIYDSAGQERYKSISTSYIKGADGIILVFDLSNKESFNSLIDWMKEIKDNTKIEKNIILVGNKNDVKSEEREVQQKEIDELINNKFKDIKDLTYMETSAKENYNISQLFENISYKVLDNRKKSGRSRGKTISLHNKSDIIVENEKKKKCCGKNN